MTFVTGGVSAANTDVSAAFKAVNVTLRPGLDTENNGVYHFCDKTGLITTVAAKTATAGHLWAWRFTHATKRAVLIGFRATWTTVTGFTAAQEVGLSLWKATGYSASHSGGTAGTLTTPEMKCKTSYAAVTGVGSIQTCTTGALTAGTHTINTHPLCGGCAMELATGTTVQRSRFSIGLSLDHLLDDRFIFVQNEGLILGNEILMGAAGTARVWIECSWLEVDTGGSWG